MTNQPPRTGSVKDRNLREQVSNRHRNIIEPQPESTICQESSQSVRQELKKSVSQTHGEQGELRKRKRSPTLSQDMFPKLSKLQVENLKRLHKNQREKQRRFEVNAQIIQLAEVLGLPGNKGIEKVMILKQAVSALRASRNHQEPRSPAEATQWGASEKQQVLQSRRSL